MEPKPVIHLRNVKRFINRYEQKTKAYISEENIINYSIRFIEESNIS